MPCILVCAGSAGGEGRGAGAPKCVAVCMGRRAGEGGQYKADKDSEGASEDDIVVYTGAFGQGDGGAAAYTGVYWQGKGVHRHIHLCL